MGTMAYRTSSKTAAVAKNSIQDTTSLSLAQLAREKLRKSSKLQLGVTLSNPHSCSVSRCGCVADPIAPSKQRSSSKERSSCAQRSPSKARSSSKQRSASKQGAAVKVSVTLPLAAVASRAVEVTSQAEMATPTPHALTEAALLKSMKLLAELSKLDLDTDADGTGRRQGRNDSSDIELSRSDGDATEELPERIKDTDSNDGSEQVRLLRLASDVWSRMTDETTEPSRSDSNSSLPSWSSSFESAVADSDAVRATDDVTRADDLFGDALRAILRGEVTCSSATDGHDDAAGRTKAILVSALHRVGEVDSREAAIATKTSAVQRQPTLGQPLLPTPRVEPVAHSPRVACLQDQFVPRTLQPSGALCAAMGGSPRMLSMTPVLSHQAFAPQIGRGTSGGYTLFQPDAPQAGAMATANATSAAVAAAVSSATAAALLGTPLGLNKSASCLTITTTTTSTISRIATTSAAPYAELRPRIR